MASLTAAVGIRNGMAVMPNRPADIDTVTGLFDRIRVAQGGSAEIGGLWPTERNALILEVTAQIVTFQTVNVRPVIDGVIDRDGGTLRLMNQLAFNPAPGGFSATAVPAPGGLSESVGPIGIYVADVGLMAGSRPIQPMVANASYVRKLVRVEGSSINWFGVVFPSASKGQGSVPHINFTPSPWQGGYQDGTYDSFTAWSKLWDDYTSVIGGQIAASGADQILVIPFYRNSQARHLGDFLVNWQEVIAAVVTAALNSIDPYMLRDTFTFNRIVSSSFSNGWVTHHAFNTQAASAAAATTILFDLDGVAGGSNWQPSNGVIYRNRPSPMNTSPVGSVWYVGGRWGNRFAQLYGWNMNTHACCRNHLLYHGLTLYCT
jgi:hypothetical protein